MRFRNDQERYEWTVELTSDLLSTMTELRLDDTPEPDEMKVVRFVEQLLASIETEEGPNCLDSEWLIAGWLMQSGVGVERCYSEAVDLVQSYWFD